MGERPETTPSEEVEPDHERRTRQLGELLQETRVVMPGVQILFAFLLTVTFQSRYAMTTDFQKDVHLGALLCGAGATICFIAPVVYHRILFEHRDKPHLIRVANEFLIAGVAFLALSMSLSVLLVCDFTFGGTTAGIVAGLLVVAFAWFWFGLPLTRRLRGERSH